jgi:hypothetical protein
MKKQLQKVRKSLLIASIYWLLTATSVFAQEPVPNAPNDVIYLYNDEMVKGVQIVGITADKVLIREKNGKEISISKSKLLMAFNKQGNFIVINRLSQNLDSAKTQIQEFINAPISTDKCDFLIKLTPDLSLIPVARIAYNNANVINYVTQDGNSATINKSELAAILYRDGRHQLFGKASEIAPLLADIMPDIQNGCNVKVSTTLKVNNVSRSLSTDTTASSVNRKPVILTEEEKEKYRNNSLHRLDNFVNYINVITDKSRTNDEKDLAIIQAAKLFMTDATIEVTSTKRPGSRLLKVKDYLKRLKMLPYSFTRVEWYDVKFVQDITLTPDGTYEGTISGEQRFTGEGVGEKVIYSDSTQKEARVKLESYIKIQDNEPITKWHVMLGNIRVNSDPK